MDGTDTMKRKEPRLKKKNQNPSTVTVAVLGVFILLTSIILIMWTDHIRTNKIKKQPHDLFSGNSTIYTV